MEFVKAVRAKTKLKIALTGPSGSGKTYSGLLLAQGLGKKIALIDTENASASLYADRFDFSTLNIDPPYTIQKYNLAIQAGIKAGFDVIVVDSLSHAWAGEGGLLAKKEALDGRGGNSYTNWGSITKEHEAFKSTILNASAHLICTMRSKQDYIMEVNEKGKQAPKKVGLAPIQREGMEYEFTTVFDIDMNHNAAVSKDRTALFQDEIFKITEETGHKFIEWLKGAKDEVKPNAAVDRLPGNSENINLQKSEAKPESEPGGTATHQSNGRMDLQIPPELQAASQKKFSVGIHVGKTFEAMLKEEIVMGHSWAAARIREAAKGLELPPEGKAYLDFIDKLGIEVHA